MSKNFQKELDRSRFHIVKYGLLYILLTIGIVFLALTLIKIEQESILSSAIQYYFK